MHASPTPPHPAELRAHCASFFRNFISPLFPTPQQNSQSTRPNLFLFCIHRKHDPIKRTKKRTEPSVTRGKACTDLLPAHSWPHTLRNSMEFHTPGAGLAPSDGHCPLTAQGETEWAGGVTASGISTHSVSAHSSGFSPRFKGKQNVSHTNVNIKLLSAT